MSIGFRLYSYAGYTSKDNEEKSVVLSIIKNKLVNMSKAQLHNIYFFAKRFQE